MFTTSTPARITTRRARDLQTTRIGKLAIVPRLIAGVPLLGIGLAHVFDPAAPMRPLVEAASLPAAALLSPVGVALEIVAGLLMLAGFHARVGAALAVPVMAVAVYAHIVIDVWPNGAGNEPPIFLPVAVIACALFILSRGAGRWSVDGVMSKSRSS